jgi:Protein of unknown function (DUF2750)
MAQDQATSESDYRRFIERVRESGEVWGLRCEEGWAYCVSNEFEDTDVLVFWSERAEAERHVQGDWKEHEPTAIPLDEFIDGWLRGMDEDGALVGPNWDAGLCGLEVEPREIADELTKDEA